MKKFNTDYIQVGRSSKQNNILSAIQRKKKILKPTMS